MHSDVHFPGFYAFYAPAGRWRTPAVREISPFSAVSMFHVERREWGVHYMQCNYAIYAAALCRARVSRPVAFERTPGVA